MADGSMMMIRPTRFEIAATMAADTARLAEAAKAIFDVENRARRAREVISLAIANKDPAARTDVLRDATQELRAIMDDTGAVLKEIADG